MLRNVRLPLALKAIVFPHCVDGFLSVFYRFPAVALLARCCKYLPENAAIDSVALYAPELVDVVEVADTRGGYVSDKVRRTYIVFGCQ